MTQRIFAYLEMCQDLDSLSLCQTYRGTNQSTLLEPPAQKLTHRKILQRYLFAKYAHRLFFPSYVREKIRYKEGQFPSDYTYLADHHPDLLLTLTTPEEVWAAFTHIANNEGNSAPYIVTHKADTPPGRDITPPLSIYYASLNESTGLLHPSNQPPYYVLTHKAGTQFFPGVFDNPLTDRELHMLEFKLHNIHKVLGIPTCKDTVGEYLVYDPNNQAYSKKQGRLDCFLKSLIYMSQIPEVPGRIDNLAHLVELHNEYVTDALCLLPPWVTGEDQVFTFEF
jgi:hypothetical protein